MIDAIIGVAAMKKYIEPVSALVDECRIHCSSEQIQIRAVDPANVAMVDATLDKRAFESFSADERTIGLSLEPLEDVLGFAESDDILHIKYAEDRRELELRAGGHEYEMALIDQESIRQDPEIPTLDLPGEFVLEGKQFSKLVTAADMVADHCQFGYTEETKELYSKGEGDTNTSTYSLKPGDLIRSHCSAGIEQDGEDAGDGNGDVRSIFSTDYLTDMRKPITDSAEVTFRIGDEFPCSIEYSIVDGHGEIQNLLAPRIQEDGE